MLLNEHSMQKSNKTEELSTVPDMAWAHSIMKMEVVHSSNGSKLTAVISLFSSTGAGSLQQLEAV